MREWQFSLPVVALRAVFLATLIYPLMTISSRRRVYGVEVLRSMDGPVIFASNHVSSADNPAMLLALPWRWRLRLATAIAAEAMRGRSRFQKFNVPFFFNGFLFSRSGPARGSLDYCAKLTRAGWSILFFPEGELAINGKMRPFRPGIGFLAVSLGVPVVPVHLIGSDTVIAQGSDFVRLGRSRGYMEIRFGQPIHIPAGVKYDVATQIIRDAVVSLSPEDVS